MLQLALLVVRLVALATHSAVAPPPSSTVSLMTSDKLGNFEPDGWEGYACTFAEWTACVNSTTVSCNDSKSTCLKCTSKRGTAPAPITCTRTGTHTQYHFPAGGVFPVVEQFHLPPNTSIIGAANPNDPADMTRQNTDVAGHTWFVVPARNTLCGDDPMCKDSTARGSTACSGDPRTHRQGFLMASNSMLKDINYQGGDLGRDASEGTLCGPGAVELPGCLSGEGCAAWGSDRPDPGSLLHEESKESVACFLRGGVDPSVTKCAGTKPADKAFSTWVFDRKAGTWTDHAKTNCYPPHNGANWGTGDLTTKTKTYTVATCQTTCKGNPKCNAITVGVALKPKPPRSHATNGRGVVSNVVIQNVRFSDAVRRADIKQMAGKDNGARCNRGEALDDDGKHVRAHQVTFWVAKLPDSDQMAGRTHKNIMVNNIVSMNSRADGFNVHGAVHGLTLQNSHLENSGDDCIGIWSTGIEDMLIRNVTARNCAVTAGAQSNWGSCMGTYAFHSLALDGLKCYDPFLEATGCEARTHYTAIHLNHAFSMDCMPMGATLSLAGIEYYASVQPTTPLARPKCGQCGSCCGPCSMDGFNNLTVAYVDDSVPVGSCMRAHTGPSC